MSLILHFSRVSDSTWTLCSVLQFIPIPSSGGLRRVDWAEDKRVRMVGFWFCWLLLVTLPSRSLTSPNMESLLIKTLMDGYDKNARPAPNVSDAVHVYFKLELQQIIDVDEQNQVILLNVWLNFVWNDFRLQWDQNVFGGAIDVRLPYGKLWRPDVLLFNSVDPEFDTTYHSNMIVDYNGTITWIPPGITRSSCKIDIRYFPFDDQKCEMKFGSWTYGKRRLTLHVLEDGIETEEYQQLNNDEWILTSSPVDLSDYPYDGETYQSFVISFHLRRRTLYYAFNIIIPSLLITGMSLVGFSLPVEAEMTVLAAICVCFEIVAKVTPPTSESIPLLGIFFFCHMIIVTISTVASVFILNLDYRTVKTHVMGAWTRRILLNWLPWLLMMDRPNRPIEPPPFLPDHVRRRCLAGTGDENVKRDWCHICMGTDGAHHGRNGGIFTIGCHQDDPTASECETMENRVQTCLRQLITKRPRGARQDGNMTDMLVMLQELYKLVKSMTDKAPETDEEDKAAYDWQFAGRVIDRLCLFLFTILLAFSTMIILFSAPHVMA